MTVLTGLVVAQWLGTSLWFSSSIAIPSLIRDWGLQAGDIGLLVSAVQLGFIFGTFVFSLTNLADRLPASQVFLVSAVAGAVANLLFAWLASGLWEALFYRFATGFFLAGMIPVANKIAVSWAPERMGQALGWLVGAQVLGSGTPALLAFLGTQLTWQTVLTAASGMAAVSGLMVLAIGSGPHLQPAQRVDLRMMLRVFAIPAYRGAALGYFGHMWELIAVWVLAPYLVMEGLSRLGLESTALVNLGVFLIFAVGAAGCVVGGLVSRWAGSRAVAAWAMGISGAFCLLAPALANWNPWLYLAGLCVWGIAVVADSPQFSALSARACPPDYVATALTVQNGIGFALSIISIELTSRLWTDWGLWVTWLLLPGPLLGLALMLHPRNR